MMFRRKKKLPAKKSRVNTDDVIIGAAKTIGGAIGTASGAVEIGRQSAAQAKNIDSAGLKAAVGEKRSAAVKKTKGLRKQASKQVDETKNKVAEGMWRSEFERPIYFVEMRDGYTCCWCSIKRVHFARDAGS